MSSVISQHRGKVAFALTIALGLFALLPGAWGAALAQTAGQPTSQPTVEETVGAGEQATIPASDQVTIEIPAGAVAVDAVITFRSAGDASSSDINDDDVQDTLQQAIVSLGVIVPPAVSSGDALLVQVFVLDALDEDGNEITFDEPVTIEIELTDEILEAAGGDASNIVLQFFDEATNQWTPVACTASGNTLSCDVDHFSVWSLVVQVSGTGGTGAPSPSDTGDGVTEGNATAWIVALLAGVAVVGTASARFAMKRTRS